MTRPLAVTGFSMLITLFVMSCCNNNNMAIGVAFSAALIAFVVFICIRKIRQDRTLPTAAAAVIISLLLLLLNNGIYYEGAKALAGKTVTVSGTLSSLPYENDGSNYYIIKAETIDGEKSNLNIRLVSKSPLSIEPTDRVTVNAKLFVLGENDDEVLKYYKSKSLFLGGNGISDVSVEKSACKNISTLILKLRSSFTKEIMSRISGDNGALICGLCFGDKTNIPRIVTTGFSAAGVSHLLAVSGLHLSVWSTLLYGIMRKMRASKKLSSVVSILFIVFFAILTGLNPPVIRAGSMLSLMFTANLFRREADSLNSIGMSLCILLAANPYMASSVSLLLSLCATLGMILILKPINSILDKPIRSVKNKAFTKCYKAVSVLVSVSISVSIFTLPVFMLYIHSFSFLAVFSNLLMVTAGSICMTAGGLSSLAFLFRLDSIGNPLLFVSAAISEYLIKLTSAVSKLHFTLVSVNSDIVRITAVIVLAIISVFIISGFKNRKHVKGTAITLCLALFVSVFSAFAADYSKLRIAVASVGNGTAVVLKIKGQTAIIGCGGDYFSGSTICDIMSEYGSTNADYLILPQNNDYCLSGVGRVMQTYNIGTVYLPLKQTAEKYNFKNVVYLSNEPVAVLGEVYVTMSEGNNIVTVVYKDFKAVIIFDDESFKYKLNGDLLICRNKIPSAANVDFLMTVVSTDNKNPENPDNIQNVLLTSVNGNISFTIDNKSKMTYRRMN